MKLIYAVFPHLDPAARAVAQIERDSDETQREQATLTLHEHDLRNIDLPRSGNFAYGSAIIGAVLVGGSVGLILTMMMAGAFARVGGPATIIGSKPIDVILLTLATAMFGAIAAGLAGTAGNRARVRMLQRKLTGDRVLLTLETTGERVEAILRTLTRSGAVEAGTI